MEFSRELRPEVLSGEITVSFRLWQRAKVKSGNRYRVGPGHIEVDSVDLIPFAAIDEADLRRSGEADLETLRRRAAHAPVQSATTRSSTESSSTLSSKTDPDNKQGLAPLPSTGSTQPTVEAGNNGRSTLDEVSLRWNEPLAVELTAAVQRGDAERLRRLLDKRPELARARIVAQGDTSPSRTVCISSPTGPAIGATHERS